MLPRALATPLAAVCLLLAALAASAPAQEPRLIDQSPFDELTLKMDNVVLKLRPLELEPRRPLQNETPDFKLRVRLQDRPNQQYEVRWADIAKVRLFEQLVMEEAAALVRAKRFDEAYEYYVFLDEKYGTFPGVNEAYAAFLLAEAEHWRSLGKLDQALALLNEAHARQPKLAALEELLSQTVDRLVEGYLQAGRHAAARRLLAGLAAKYPENSVAQQRRARLAEQASAAMQAAEQAKAAEKWREAFEAASRAVALLPDLPGAKELLVEIKTHYTILPVGVLRLAPPDDLQPAVSWSVRRQRRLIHRQLVEPLVTTEGLTWESPVAKVEPQQGKALRITLLDGKRFSSGVPLTSHDVLASMRRSAAGRSPLESLALPRGAEGVSARELQCTWDGSAAVLRGALRVPLVPWSVPASAPAECDRLPGLGPYQVAARTAEDVRYVRNPHASDAGEALPAEIAERAYPPDEALAALLRGEIAVLDRVPTWRVPELLGGKVALVRYGAPTRHFLVVNPRQAWLARPLARRALLHGIFRQQILDDALLGTPDENRGKLLNSLLGLAANAPSVAYDPRMMLAILQAAQPASAQASPAQLRLVLAHPQSETARRACREIQQQLGLESRGPAIELHEFPGDSWPASDNWDLLYVEWMFTDPVCDALSLLGRLSLCQRSAALTDALEHLSRAPDANAAQAALAHVDGLVAEELPLLPLWQLTEYAAHDKRLQGLGVAPLTLYQQVEQWRFSADVRP